LLRGYWAHIDLQLAYPSLSLDYLAEALHDHALLKRNNQDLHFLDPFGSSFPWLRVISSLKDYPKTIATPLIIEETRTSLVNQLVAWLKAISYDPVPYVEDERIKNFLWIPPHVPFDCVGHNCLPTGLLISGLLMNVHP
jgi:hypothetical protein